LEPKLIVVGIHPVKTNVPCHLIEIAVANTNNGEFDWDQITQELPGVPQGNWQAAYDEQQIPAADERVHYAFFFHFLDPSRPLCTPFGEIDLPEPTPLPTHLRDIEYYPLD